MFALTGTGIGRRVAIGKAMVLDRSRQEIPKYEVSQDQVHSEIKRFQSALARTRAELRRIQKEIPDHAPHEANAFIDVHLLMLEDPVIAEQPVRAMEEHSYNAEWALKTQADTLVEFFMNIEDPYLRSRKDDIHQVVNRILEELTIENDPPAASLDGTMAGHVVIADDLTPGNLVTLHHRGITAFVTSLGGPISHTSILARSLGIPAVVGLHHAVQYLHNGDLLAVDGQTGTVLVDLNQTLLTEFQQRQSNQAQREQQLSALQKEPAITCDGYTVSLLANIELPEETDMLERFGANGVGLYRTEFLFMNRSEPPDEAEQYEAYRDVLDTLTGPITIRTLDLGADKQVDGGRADGATKINPALGLRAIRLCLSEPNLFRPQLRAILRASMNGRARIMIPMLSSLSELEQALEIVHEVKHDLAREGIEFDPKVPIGGMIEVPAAAIAADLFANRLDFLSIGTNDLIQYTLAIDRIDDEVNYLYDPLHPAVLRLIHNVICAGREAGIPVSLCGEMAGDPDYTRLLLGLGLVEFSMEPTRLLEIKERVRTSEREKLLGQTQQILECADPTQLRMMVDQLNQGGEQKYELVP
jgi:phosphotransferase system enzyme I (PtsI)